MTDWLHFKNRCASQSSLAVGNLSFFISPTTIRDRVQCPRQNTEIWMWGASGERFQDPRTGGKPSMENSQAHTRPAPPEGNQKCGLKLQAPSFPGSPLVPCVPALVLEGRPESGPLCSRMLQASEATDAVPSDSSHEHTHTAPHPRVFSQVSLPALL